MLSNSSILGNKQKRIRFVKPCIIQLHDYLTYTRTGYFYTNFFTPQTLHLFTPIFFTPNFLHFLYQIYSHFLVDPVGYQLLVDLRRA
mgnify:CR=1 FL=1